MTPLRTDMMLKDTHIPNQPHLWTTKPAQIGPINKPAAHEMFISAYIFPAPPEGILSSPWTSLAQLSANIEIAHQCDIKAVNIAVPITKTQMQKTIFALIESFVAIPKVMKTGPRARKLRTEG
jgi:hypothetical protein